MILAKAWSDITPMPSHGVYMFRNIKKKKISYNQRKENRVCQIQLAVYI